MNRLLLSVFDFFSQRRWLAVGLLFILLGIFGFFTSKLNFEEDVFQMLPRDKSSESLRTFMENSRFSDRIMITVSFGDSNNTEADQLIQPIVSIADSIQLHLGRFVRSVNLRSDEMMMSRILDITGEHLPVFLDSSDYVIIDSLLEQESIVRKTESNYRTLISPSGIALRSLISSDPLGFQMLVLQKLQRLAGDESIELYDGYYISRDRQSIFLFLDPVYSSSQTDDNSTFFNELDQLIEEIMAQYPGMQAHYFGAPAVAAANSMQIRSDIYHTISITLALLLLIFITFFRNIRSPLTVLIPVIFGALFSLTLIYFIKGSISVISMGAGSLVLGIAVNYSLHFLIHRRVNFDSRETIREISFPMIAGGLTTIGGFLCLQFVNAPVLQDLGLYAALSLAGAAIATLIFLPHLVNTKRTNNHVSSNNTDGLSSLISGVVYGNRKIALLILILTPVLFWFAGKVEFETDMNRINFMPEKLRESEKFIAEKSNFYQKSIFTLSTGNTLQDALQVEESKKRNAQLLIKEGAILNHTSVTDFLPSTITQQERLNRWNQYWTNEKRDSLVFQLNQAGVNAGFKNGAFLEFQNSLTKEYNTLGEEEQAFISGELLRSFIDTTAGKISVAGIIKAAPDSSEQIYSKLKEDTHFHIFDRQHITSRLVEMVSEDFNFITLWTSLLVLFALLLIYGRIELTIISFLPMVLTWIWILGLMALLGIKFNIINIVLSTLIFALGDDFCIFTTDKLMNRYARGDTSKDSTPVSIFMSAAATLAGIGALIFAEHPALQSIALVSIIGIFSVWVMSQVIQPILFHIIITKPTSQGHQPYVFLDTLKSIFAFTYFVTGSLLISFIGFIFFRVIPGKSQWKKKAFHFIMSRFTGSMIYIMVNVKKQIINNHNEDFSKPAIIIANHSSFLDILLTVMLHPKLILLTNDWVWNSPVFGSAVQYAEYYPVSQGAENTISKLADKVAEGYSIVVFPEGTRSADGKIGRFHKGAFYLSQELKTDILPILIHGANYTMTKGFFFLKNGQLTLKYLPRIKHDDQIYGAELREKAKNIGRYFRDEYANLAQQLENTDYFRNHVIHNFMFKGPVLEWYTRIKIKLENNYRWFNRIIPRKGVITDMGCGYGYLSYMLALTSAERKITGIDYDHQKTEIADNGFGKPANLNFIAADITNYPIAHSDVFILNDVLHYLSEPEQKLVLKNCLSKLNPGGMLVIRDGIREHSRRHIGTMISELFSTRILGFNKTSKEGLSFISRELISTFASENRLISEEVDNTQFTSNVTFVLRKSI